MTWWTAARLPWWSSTPLYVHHAGLSCQPLGTGRRHSFAVVRTLQEPRARVCSCGRLVQAQVSARREGSPCFHSRVDWLNFRSDGVLVAKMDADAHGSFASKYGVKGFPTIKWFGDNVDEPGACHALSRRMSPRHGTHPHRGLRGRARRCWHRGLHQPAHRSAQEPAP